MTHIPPEVARQAKLIKRLENNRLLSPTQRKQLDHARLIVAKWALESEGLPVTFSNLAVTLGAKGKDSLQAISEFTRPSFGDNEVNRTPLVLENRFGENQADDAAGV